MERLIQLAWDSTLVIGAVALAVAIGLSIWRWRKAHSEQHRAQACLRTLMFQTQLGKLAQEIAELDHKPSYARNHKVKAATLAYDRLLGEACEHAGISSTPQSRHEDLERIRRERALSAAGWTW